MVLGAEATWAAAGVQPLQGVDLYRQMRRELDVLPIVRTAVEDCGIPSPQEAMVALDAFLQWVAVIPLAGDQPYVMLKGVVDQAWHAFILNTRRYRQFCELYFGAFLDHKPSPGDPPARLVASTLQILKTHLGDELHPWLLQWEQAPPAASS
jgi:hypothetical protein